MVGGWLRWWVGVSGGTWVSVFVPVGGGPVFLFYYDSSLFFSTISTVSAILREYHYQ